MLPVMVLEGEAPTIKWNVIDARNNARIHSGRSGAAAGGAANTNTKKKRSQFNAILKKVC